MTDTISIQAIKLTAQEYRNQYPETMQLMELIDGKVMTMPAPKDIHSQIVANLMWLLMNQVRTHNLGQVRTGSTDVYLDEFHVVQPDVFFIARDNDRCKREEDGYLHGAPDLCIEVLSDSTRHHDRVTKSALYARHGVAEYWIVDPDSQTVEVYTRENDTFHLQGAYGESDSFRADVLPDFIVTVRAIFAG